MSQFRRALWHINRSPARSIVKAVRNFADREHVVERKRLGQTIFRSADVLEAATTLNDNGFVVLADLLDRDLLEELARASDARLQGAKNRDVYELTSHKDFWTRLLDEDMEDGQFPASSPFVRFALQAKVVSLMTEIFGTVPRLDYVALTYSNFSEKPLAYSQLWHRDHDDTRVVKLFVYFTDVTEDGDGPFTFFTAPETDRVGFSLKSHRSDDEIPLDVAKSRSIFGKRLTVFAVETSRCLHMGSRVAEGHERLMYTATFFSPPRIFPEPSPLFRPTGAETPIQSKILLAD